MIALYSHSRVSRAFVARLLDIGGPQLDSLIASRALPRPTRHRIDQGKDGYWFWIWRDIAPSLANLCGTGRRRL